MDCGTAASMKGTKGTTARRDNFGNVSQHTGTGDAARLQGWSSSADITRQTQ